MKRWVVALTLVGVLLMAGALAVWADPTNVGGSFTTLSCSSNGPAVFPGKGIPHGRPFALVLEATVLSPTNVGGS
jgi:hypothetical protein